MILAEATTHGPLAPQRPVNPSRQLQVASALQTALPPHCVLWRDEDTRPYECDGLSMYRQLPMVVVLPETEAHVIQVLKICRDLAVPVVARGAGTGLSGGAMPHAEGVLLGMAKFNRITQVAMGRNWPRASGGEQTQVVAEFSKMLVRTYSNALANLKDLDVQVRDSRNNSAADVTVRTQMIGRAKPVAIDYTLSSASGGWRVYDVTVEGVSLITAYRDEFNGVVGSSGVPGLIAALKQKNAK
jgi:hypothetical protein